MDNEKELLEFDTINFMIIEVDPITLQQVEKSQLTDLELQMPVGAKYDILKYKERLYAIKEMRFDADMGASVLFVIDMQKANEELRKAQTQKRLGLQVPGQNMRRT